jgi:hypothetical protein
MAAAAAATSALQAAGRDFGLVVVESLDLRWGLLFADLESGEDEEYVAAIELMYEGYLFHYRMSRICVPLESERETALLAGDFFYARGLRIVAARGEHEAVGLLARLMAACAHLRSAGMPFSTDDVLWAYTTGGLVALRGGVSPTQVNDLFERFDAVLADGVSFDVVEQVFAAARRLGLKRAAILEAELAKAGAGPAADARADDGPSADPPSAGKSGR